jgi:ribosomal protein L37AE/L43A
MDSLVLLASCLEQGRTAIAPALVDVGQRRRLERLQQIGALVQARARAVICPRCEAHSVRVIAAGSALCAECGQVALALEDMQRLTPDGDWLRRRMAQALGLAGESAWPIVPGRVWRIGDIGRAGARHRVLFGQQMADVAVQRALLAKWPTHVGEIPTILVTTTPLDRMYLPGVPVTVVPLTTAFHVRGNGLVADDTVWAGLRTGVSVLSARARQGLFAHDFSDVLLPGESAPIALTSTQSTLLRVLWEQGGVPMLRDILLARADAGLEKPVQAFQRQKYPEANRAYHALVRSDRQGRYWMPFASAFET